MTSGSPGIDRFLADEQVTSASVPGDTLWALTDHLGTVRDLVRYDGQVESVVHRTYDAFGNVTSEVNPESVDILFGFTGRLLDETTGLQNNLNRWYDAAVGRWVSEDPIGFEAGDGNLYRYLRNENTYSIDPSGLYDGNFDDPRFRPPGLPHEKPKNSDGRGNNREDHDGGRGDWLSFLDEGYWFGHRSCLGSNEWVLYNWGADSEHLIIYSTIVFRGPDEPILFHIFTGDEIPPPGDSYTDPFFPPYF